MATIRQGLWDNKTNTQEEVQITPISWIPIKMMMTLPIDICIKGNTRLKDAYRLVSWRLGSNISCRQLNNKCSILFLFLIFTKLERSHVELYEIWRLDKNASDWILYLIVFSITSLFDKRMQNQSMVTITYPMILFMHKNQRWIRVLLI